MPKRRTPKRGRPYPGPTGDDRTYHLPEDIEAWEASHAAYHAAQYLIHPERYGEPVAVVTGPVAIAERRQPDEQAPADPVRKARFNEAVAYVRDYVGTWGFILDIRAKREWGTKYLRLSDRQVEVILNAKARDAARLVEAVARKSTGIDLNVLPEGTTRYAVENAAGELTFIRIDRVTDGKWAGWVFVKQIVGGGYAGQDVEERLGAQRPNDAYSGSFGSLLEKVIADPTTAAARFGLELGKCSVCGRTLTNAESREAGIGPECSKRWAA